MTTTKQKKPVRQSQGLLIRPLPDLEEWLRKQAKTETRTMTAIINRALAAERAKIEQAA